MTEPIRRKLIEVALPLEAINRESVRENYIYRGNPSSLHKWWAQRPLAAARAVLFAQLVDDPSARPTEFSTLEAQDAERRRLFGLIEKLVKWESNNDKELLAQAYAEILKCTDGNPPTIVDPFAGGGSIPLEAQRLGLRAQVSDLNPVAVLINKALIEIPPRWANRPPIAPDRPKDAVDYWPRAAGLAADVRHYGSWIHAEAVRELGNLYPKAKLPNGTLATVTAWMWMRTVVCPNPACGRHLPLARSFWLSKKKARPVWLAPIVEADSIRFEVKSGNGRPTINGTVGKTGAACLACATPVPLSYIRKEGKGRRLGLQLVAVATEGVRQRVYLPASDDQSRQAFRVVVDDAPETDMPKQALGFRVQAYGMTQHRDLFTDRQLATLVTLSDLIGKAHARIAADAKEGGYEPDEAESYANAVALYLAFVLSKTADYSCTGAVWYPQEDRPKNLFARQAIPMVWDFPELNPLGTIGGTWLGSLNVVVQAMDGLIASEPAGAAIQADAATLSLPEDVAVSTDPPYYDNIAYADLSDFFYIWLRRSIGSMYSELTATMLTPKHDELIANPFIHGGKLQAEEHFERGFVQTFTRIREKHSADIPITVYYAFKQTESDDAGTASTGWETMLQGLIEAGLMVTATWPMRTERTGRVRDIGSNALASSIVLACRPRSAAADAITRRGFIAALKDMLPSALRELQQGSVAPVDLAQAAIGPGMAVYTRYSRVIEADGSEMNVRTALALINQVLDETLSEQEGDFDVDTRFCIKWFSQYEWAETDSDTADVLARATNTSVTGLARGGVFRAVAGRAHLLAPDDLSDAWNPLTDLRTSVWEVTLHLAKAVSEQGADAAAHLMASAGQRVDLDVVKELAYLLYSICERRGWNASALLFNGLGTSWIDLDAAARSVALKPALTQGTFDFDGEGDE